MKKRQLNIYTVENILRSLYRERGTPPAKTADEITTDILGSTATVEKVDTMSSAISRLRGTKRVKKVGEEKARVGRGRPKFRYRITENGKRFYEYKYL